MISPPIPTTAWQEMNQNYLTIALERVRVALQNYVDRDQGNAGDRALPVLPDEPTSQLQWLTMALQLSEFERDLLVLCAGVELSGSLAQLCGKAQGNPQLTYPTFSLALAALSQAHWDAIAPVRPLRQWRLVELGSGEGLSQSRLKIDERVLHYLNGVSYLDDRLRGWMMPLDGAVPLPLSHQNLADRMVAAWQGEPVLSSMPNDMPAVQMCGEQWDAQEAIAVAACATLELRLYRLVAADLPTAPAEREALARLWQRESILSRAALLVECETLESRHLLAFVEDIRGAVILLSRDRIWLRRPMLRLTVPPLTMAEQRQLWQEALQGVTEPGVTGQGVTGQGVTDLHEQVEAIAAQFSLSAPAIQAIASELRATGRIGAAVASPAMSPAVNGNGQPEKGLQSLLWEACRTYARTRLDDLAQPIQPVATWEDLILPDLQRQMLREIAAQVRQRSLVYETWGVTANASSGLGISALFVGASGTGKTLAAEVLAQALQLDLYRIDLSQVVSKYIGETEKNLRRVFDAAESGGAILLFDEADALFGKRSEVKDSHDRYANIEVSYLLQRMEAYRGLAILTTNLRTAIDGAFLRRIRFVVQFPFPDVAQRMKIWQRMLPPRLPTEGVEVRRLAQLNVPGGNIRTISVNAAFLAADEGKPLGMKHLLRATQGEYSKLEKSLTELEVSGWI